jgi:hypothetical protein
MNFFMGIASFVRFHEGATRDLCVMFLIPERLFRKFGSFSARDDSLMHAD